ncbi:hypothetical protein QNM97_13625 [Gordonia sp. L191]|uniref:hypothetical protein n=1 Tax=Gordonia sp. L191 TaxID=2982699 RepID=UPI0024BF286A|nr:hypothetical protein [Gordonia sp. L191]WHU45090.1 hypothetical protein QNM97_13625 [Gordonia sp. L191]
MAPNPGKKRRNLADMTSQPLRLDYRRRADAVLVVDGPIYLSVAGDRLHQREWHHRGRVVDFALNQYITCDHPDNPGGESADIARVDTCHSEVHKHQFYRSGRPQQRDVICALHDADSLEQAEDMICGCYDACYFDMADEWEDRLVRWKDGE